MAHAYTPGLRVARQAVVRKQRRLPLEGEVVVAAGERVRRDQVVARTALPGKVTTLNLTNRLGVAPEEVPQYLLRREGESVQAGEPLAETRPLIKWFKTVVTSPVSATVESISAVTGQVMLREPPRPVEVLAYVDGEVVEVMPGQGVVVETSGAYVQGIFGVGGERWGPLRMVVDAPDERIEPERIGADCAGQVLVVGSLISAEALARARQVGVVGVIGGGIRDQDLRDLLGYDLGVAITGTEEIGLSVIATEGFGPIAMARKTFEILSCCPGQVASLSGATQIRAGVVRPELIVPATDPAAPAADPGVAGQGGLEAGALVRAIRVPYFGRIGRVRSLPSELQTMESGARVRVLEVEFEDGGRAVLPRANVERIEE